MALFEIEVTELRSVRCQYLVSARDLEHAKQLAAIGHTISEEQERQPPDVVHREVGDGRPAEDDVA